MKKLLSLFALLLVFTGCNSVPTTNQPDAAQVARIAAMAESITAIGAQGFLARNPEALPNLIAIAEAIDLAIATKDAPPPSGLQSVISSAIGQFGGPYGALISLAVNGGMAFYKQFYSANVSSQLDKQPAFKAVLAGMARGLRSGVPVVAGSSEELDLVLRPAK